jgi:hypothetical protein
VNTFFTRVRVNAGFSSLQLSKAWLLLFMVAVFLLAGCVSPQMRPVSATEKHLRLTKAVTVERFWGFASLPPGIYNPVAEVGDYIRFNSAGTVPVKSAGVNFFWSGGLDLPISIVRGESSQLKPRLWFVDPQKLFTSTPTIIEIDQPVPFELIDSP